MPAMKRWMALLLLGLLIQVGMSWTPAASASAARFSVSPQEGSPGDRFTVASIDRCPPPAEGGDPVVHIRYSLPPRSDLVENFDVDLQLKQDGSWEGSIETRADRTGEYNITAVCASGNASSRPSYESQTFTATSRGEGYLLVTAAGSVHAFGDAFALGNATTARPSTGLATRAGKANGYWVVGSDGGVTTFGRAAFAGSLGDGRLNADVVDIESTNQANGYWLAAADGGVFAFGDAPFYGSLGATRLNKPIVGIAATAAADGYWLAAADGGVFAFGGAQFYGSLGGMPLNKPIVGIAATASGAGYWLVASDGGVFSFGDATFYGSLGGMPLNKPVVGIAATASGAGYWLVAEDGGVFSFGDAGYHGNATAAASPIVGIASS